MEQNQNTSRAEPPSTTLPRAKQDILKEMSAQSCQTEIVRVYAVGAGITCGPFKRSGERPIRTEIDAHGNVLVIDPNKCGGESGGGIKELRRKHRLLLMMRLQGATYEEIHEQIGLSVSQIGVVCRSPLFKLELAKLEKGLEDRIVDVNSRFRNLGPSAVNTVQEVMLQGKTGMERLAAAKAVLDYGGNKPVEKKEIVHDFGQTVKNAWQKRQQLIQQGQPQVGAPALSRPASPAQLSHTSLYCETSDASSGGTSTLEEAIDISPIVEDVQGVSRAAASPQPPQEEFIPDSYFSEDELQEAQTALDALDPSDRAASLFKRPVRTKKQTKSESAEKRADAAVDSIVQRRLLDAAEQRRAAA